MPSPLHGLNILEPHPAASESTDQLPPDVAAQLAFWSTIGFSNVDDPSSVFGGGFSLPAPSTAPNTLDELVRLGEEELQQTYRNVDQFQVPPQQGVSPPAHPHKKARTVSSLKHESSSLAAMTSADRTTAAALVDDSEDDDDDDVDSTGIGPGSVKQKNSLTPLTPADDKRRRNTAASARFRAKKKEREQAMEKRAKELEDRVTELERECETLRRENGWLKGLVVGVTQAGGDINVGTFASAPFSGAPPAAGSKRKHSG